MAQGRVVGTITNTLAHMRTFFKLCGYSTIPLNSSQVINAVRAIRITLRHIPRAKLPVTPDILRAVIKQVHTTSYPYHMRAAILVMFFGFLRQSNMAPHSVKTYDHTRQLARRDVIIHSDHVEVRLKWSKTMQEGRTPLTLVLARQKGSPICPHAAVSRLYKHYPTVKGKHPLLSFSDGNPMTVGYIKSQWAGLLMKVGLSTAKLSLHSLRRGGAHHAYHNGASLQDVKAHGTWASDAVAAYIKPKHAQRTSVHTAMANL